MACIRCAVYLGDRSKRFTAIAGPKPCADGSFAIHACAATQGGEDPVTALPEGWTLAPASPRYQAKVRTI